MTLPPSLRAGLVLAVFVGVGLAGVAVVHERTAERIEAAERAVVLDRLAAVLPEGHDNEPADAAYERPSPFEGAAPMRIFPAYSGSDYLGAAAEIETPEGYSGPIRLLVGLTPEGEIIGVRTVAHRETPGLGDAIEAGRSDWIRGFSGRALGDPPADDWAVARDGGAFDGITGATITARAVVDAVRAVVVDHDQHPEAYRGVDQAEHAEPIELDTETASEEGAGP